MTHDVMSNTLLATAGKVYFLEINPNCGVFYPPEEMDGACADFILSLDQQHGGHAGFIDAIVHAALHRAEARKAAHTVQVGVWCDKTFNIAFTWQV